MENLKRVLGLLDEGKRIYRIHEENEVQKEEFLYCKLMHEIVFGDKGFVETLGPTWNLILDPRFYAIENQFILNRRAIFGGDARLGKQYINDDGSFSSTIGDLETYAEILGEGRNLHNVLTHPNEKCPIRIWLERIYKGYSVIKPHLSIKCICPDDQKIDPSTFKEADDELIWKYIKQECPNRGFNKDGSPNKYGTMMFELVKLDLIGLIHDYAETPLIDSYIYLADNGVVIDAENVDKLDPHGLDHQRVLQEIDILEQALTHRATLRVTAVKVLNSLRFDSYVESTIGKDGQPLQLTDVERDILLKMVFTSNWPDDKPLLLTNLLGFISSCAQKSFEERQSTQLNKLQNKSKSIIDGLKDGSMRPINHYTEPVKEIPDDAQEDEVMRYASMLDSLTQNPLKAQLFQVYVAAEEEGEVGVLDILTPIFDPNYVLTEDTYFNMLRAVTHRVKSLRVVDSEEVTPRGTSETATVKEVRQFEEEFSPKLAKIL